MWETTLARYIRETALGYEPEPTSTPANDAGVLELNRIGVNLNQLTHQANAGQFGPDETRQIQDVLAEITAAIKKL